MTKVKRSKKKVKHTFDEIVAKMIRKSKCAKENNEAIEIDDFQMIGNKEDFRRWDEKFQNIIADNLVPFRASHKKTNRTWKKIRTKESLNNLFRLMRIKFRLSTKKEYSLVKTTLHDTFLNVFLYVNSLDDASIENIDEMLKDNSIEGIREQLPHIDTEKLKEALVS